MNPDQYIIVKVKHKRTSVKGWRQIMRSPSKKHKHGPRQIELASVDFQNLNSLYFLADFESCSLAACLFLLLLCLAACSATMSDKSSLLSIASCSRTAASALAVGGNHVWSPTQSLWLSLLIQQMIDCENLLYLVGYVFLAASHLWPSVEGSFSISKWAMISLIYQKS